MARPAGGTATWNSSATLSRCSTGSPSTCPEEAAGRDRLRGKAREKGLCVAMADRAPVVGGQAVGRVERGGEGGRDAVVVGRVGAEQYVTGPGQRAQGGQGRAR